MPWSNNYSSDYSINRDKKVEEFLKNGMEVAGNLEDEEVDIEDQTLNCVEFLENGSIGEDLSSEMND